MFEINDDTDAELRDAEVIEHFAAFNIGDLVDHLCVHNHGAKGDEIRDEFTHMMSFVEDLESTLLIECDPPNLELHGERILIKLLIQTVAQIVEDLPRAAHDLEHFF